MKRGALKISLLTLLPIFLIAQKGYPIGEVTTIGSREASLGSASVALISSFSVFHNQAAIAWHKEPFIAIDYSKPYLIDGLSQKAVALIIPARLASFGLSVEQKGITGYCESRIGFTLAKKLGKSFSAGIQFNYFLNSFPEQGKNLGTLCVEFGVLYSSLRNVNIGLHIFNPSKAYVESLNYHSEIPFGGEMGIAVNSTPELLLTSSIAIYCQKPINFGVGMEYGILENIYLRGGISGKPVRHSVGAGFKCRYFSIDTAFVHHETLGYTPAFSLTVKF